MWHYALVIEIKKIGIYDLLILTFFKVFTSSKKSKILFLGTGSSMGTPNPLHLMQDAPHMYGKEVSIMYVILKPSFYLYNVVLNAGQTRVTQEIIRIIVAIPQFLFKTPN